MKRILKLLLIPVAVCVVAASAVAPHPAAYVFDVPSASYEGSDR